MHETLGIKDAIPTNYAAWLGTYNEDADGFDIKLDDVLFTDSLEEVTAWHASDDGLAEGQTLGISDRDGLLSMITRDAESYEVWCR
jgi:hypothetical protein